MMNVNGLTKSLCDQASIIAIHFTTTERKASLTIAMMIAKGQIQLFPRLDLLPPPEYVGRQQVTIALLY
ncbi:MAG: hypothetical protein CML22_01645 [Rheinheimera sp.]|nr:hypothetical protein [Rheinheimera sp.]MBM32993.1 hypothetical protein [Rheinheimera sp.]